MAEQIDLPFGSAGGPKEAQIQSYSSGGANAITWRLRLNHLFEARNGLTSNYFDALLLLDRIARTTYVDAVYCYRPSSVVYRSVCLSQ